MITIIFLVVITTILLAILYVLKKGFNEIIAGLNSISKRLSELEPKSDKDK